MTSETTEEKRPFEVAPASAARAVATALREAIAIARHEGKAVGIAPDEAEKLANLLEALADLADGNTW